jgi:hypothetical protein
MGVITGTPSASISNLPVTATVVDSTGASASDSNTISIAAVPVKLSFPSKNGQFGIPYSNLLTDQAASVP